MKARLLAIKMVRLGKEMWESSAKMAGQRLFPKLMR